MINNQNQLEKPSKYVYEIQHNFAFSAQIFEKDSIFSMIAS